MVYIEGENLDENHSEIRSLMKSRKNRNIYCPIITFIFIILCCNPLDAANETKLKEKILSLAVPQDCAEILDLTDTFLMSAKDKRNIGQVTFNMIDCESDWDFIRQQLHSIMINFKNEPLAEKAALKLMSILFVKGEFDMVINQADSFQATFSESMYLDKVLLNQASSYLAKGDSYKANQKFLLLILRFPQSPLVGRAQMGIAESYFKEKNYRDAIEQYKIARNKVQEDALKAYCEYMLGECYGFMGEKNRAIQQYNKVLESYSDFPEKELASLKLAMLLPSGNQPRPQEEKDSKQGTLVDNRESIPEQENSAQIPSKYSDRSTGNTRGYTIQVGAFSKKENAHDLLNALKLKGYDAYDLVIERNNRTIYKIRIGHCIKKEEAESISNRLLKEEAMYSFLTQCQD